MELLGQSLWDMCNMPLRNCLSEAHAACVAVEAISILQGIHEKGWAGAHLPGCLGALHMQRQGSGLLLVQGQGALAAASAHTSSMAGPQAALCNLHACQLARRSTAAAAAAAASRRAVQAGTSMGT